MSSTHAHEYILSCLALNIIKLIEREMTMNSTKRIALIEAGWHEEIVSQCYLGLMEVLSQHSYDTSLIDRYKVPGSLEIPLTAKKLANGYKDGKSDKYSIIIAAGLIVDGGIYRHDFVANAVIQGMMQVQLECEIPILSVVLTPHHFHEHEVHQQFFKDHFVIKGKEAGMACLQMLDINRLKQE